MGANKSILNYKLVHLWLINYARGYTFHRAINKNNKNGSCISSYIFTEYIKRSFTNKFNSHSFLLQPLKFGLCFLYPCIVATFYLDSLIFALNKIH